MWLLKACVAKEQIGKVKPQDDLVYQDESLRNLAIQDSTPIQGTWRTTPTMMGPGLQNGTGQPRALVTQRKFLSLKEISSHLGLQVDLSEYLIG